MTFVLLMLATAVVSYLLGGINGAIIFSIGIYHKDIRQFGSKNPGFTNFKRVFGGKYAWFVMLFDILKTALPVLIFSLLFGSLFDMRQFGAAFAGLCAMLGHAYPVWYRFEGGKAFIAGATVIGFVDWRVGLIVLAVFMLLLFTLHYMSLASITAGFLCPVLLAVFGVATPWVEVFSVLSAALLIFRHKANIKRLLMHTESKFYFKKAH